MNSNAKQYIDQALAFTGLVILNHAIALRMRPDIWASATDCAQELWASACKIEEHLRDKDGLKRFEAKLGDGTTLALAAYSHDKLGERLMWLLGRSVLSVRLVYPTLARSNAPQVQQKAAAAAPSWPCEAPTQGGTRGAPR